MTHTTKQSQLYLFSAVGIELKQGKGRGLGDFNGKCPPEDELPVRFQQMGCELIIPRPESQRVLLCSPAWRGPSGHSWACLRPFQAGIVAGAAPCATSPHSHTHPGIPRTELLPGSFPGTAPARAHPRTGLRPRLAAGGVCPLCSPARVPTPSLGSSKDHSWPPGSSGGTAVTHGSVTHGGSGGIAVTHRSVTHGGTGGIAVTHRSVTHGGTGGIPVIHRSVTHGGIGGIAVTHGSVTHGGSGGIPVTHRSVTHGGTGGTAVTHRFGHTEQPCSSGLTPKWDLDQGGNGEGRAALDFRTAQISEFFRICRT
uniref:Uncharacterized protein n=1 Tax=Cyanoderma ruficeps TaxID=181631 RepID=A0A8C3P1Y2_9PASS